jgi:hypothetical protein
MAPCKLNKCLLEMAVGSNEVLTDDPGGVIIPVVLMVIMDGLPFLSFICIFGCLVVFCYCLLCCRDALFTCFIFFFFLVLGFLCSSFLCPEALDSSALICSVSVGSISGKGFSFCNFSTFFA